MRIKALLSTLLLGTTLAGVASASPIVRDHRYQPVYQQPVVLQPAYTQPVYAAPPSPAYGFQVANNGAEVTAYAYGQDPSIEYRPRSSWLDLYQGVRLSAAGALKLPVNVDRKVTTLELQAMDGWTNIQQVRVQLRDGRVIVVNPSRDLDSHSPNLRIDLGAQASCGVQRIVLIGSGRGAFRVLGA